MSQNLQDAISAIGMIVGILLVVFALSYERREK